MNTTTQKIAHAVLFLSISIFISKLFGLIRMMLIAKYFGATFLVDAYRIATQIPEITSIILATAVGIAFLPVFTEYLTKNQENEGWQLIHSFSYLLFLFLIFFTFIGIIFSPGIIKLIAPGFLKYPHTERGTYQLSITILRITMPYFLFNQLGGFIQAILQSYKRYKLIIAWQVIPNLILILILVIFTNRYGILPLTVGFLLTGVAYFLFLLPGVLNIAKYSIRLTHPSVTRILKLMLPVIIASVVTNSVWIIDRYLASYLIEGSIATLDYAYRLVLVPTDTLIASFILVLYPILSQRYQENIEKFKDTIIVSLRIMFFLLMPTFIIFFVLSLPLTRIVYERGAFIPEATLRCSLVLRFYSLGIVALGLTEILNRAFFSFQNTKTPVKIAIVSSLVNIIGSITLVRVMDINGLATASAVAKILNVFLAYFILKRVIKLKLDKESKKAFLSIFLTSILIGFLIYLLLPYFEKPYFLSTIEGRITAFGILLIISVVGYILILYLLKNQELEIIYNDTILPQFKKFVRTGL